MSNYTQEKERLALECVSTPAKLRKRLNEARSRLADWIRPRFRNATLDVANKRLLSEDGKVALQWQLRRKPEEPESYENQQTNTGMVYCVDVTTGVLTA